MASSPGIIEINDCELKFTFGQNSWSLSGFATLVGDTVLFGEPARQQARLQPLTSFSRYWDQLSLNPMPHYNNKIRHYADLAYHQLLQLHQQAVDCETVILAVPTSFDHAKLSLILGICEQCPFQVVGLVDSALVGSADILGIGRYLHLDMQLHQCLLTQMKADQHIAVQSADIITGCGLINLYQHWAKYLSAQFIQHCRFDPMHDAQSEQQLYDLLPQILHNTDEQMQLSLQGKQINLNRQSLLRYSQGLFEPLFTAIKSLGRFDGVVLSPRIVAVPEIMLQMTDATMIAKTAIAKNCLAYQQDICLDADAVSFTTVLPNRLTSTAESYPQPTQLQAKATHILYLNTAYPISEPLFISIGAELQITRTATTQARLMLQPHRHNIALELLHGGMVKINGRVARNGDLLSTGDELMLAGSNQKLTLISLIDNEDW